MHFSVVRHRLYERLLAAGVLFHRWIYPEVCNKFVKCLLYVGNGSIRYFIQLYFVCTGVAIWPEGFHRQITRIQYISTTMRS